MTNRRITKLELVETYRNRAIRITYGERKSIKIILDESGLNIPDISKNIEYLREPIDYELIMIRLKEDTSFSCDLVEDKWFWCINYREDDSDKTSRLCKCEESVNNLFCEFLNELFGSMVEEVFGLRPYDN
jgi:hypothetical protein